MTLKVFIVLQRRARFSGCLLNARGTVSRLWFAWSVKIEINR
jgi:hypothetical protein